MKIFEWLFANVALFAIGAPGLAISLGLFWLVKDLPAPYGSWLSTLVFLTAIPIMIICGRFTYYLFDKVVNRAH
ncbi:MAG: hypothetical protein HYX63_01615 [Gammaproteobacteria bacterium]|nr:hypothetical protein [Gammaproteobacteria bacterium]